MQTALGSLGPVSQASPRSQEFLPEKAAQCVFLGTAKHRSQHVLLSSFGVCSALVMCHTSLGSGYWRIGHVPSRWDRAAIVSLSSYFLVSKDQMIGQTQRTGGCNRESTNRVWSYSPRYRVDTHTRLQTNEHNAAQNVRFLVSQIVKQETCLTPIGAFLLYKTQRATS